MSRALWMLQSGRTVGERLDQLQALTDSVQAAMEELRKEPTPDRAEVLWLRIQTAARQGRDLAHEIAAAKTGDK